METTPINDITTNQKFNLEKYPLVKITRYFDATLDRVFKAFSDEELVK